MKSQKKEIGNCTGKSFDFFGHEVNLIKIHNFLWQNEKRAFKKKNTNAMSCIKGGIKGRAAAAIAAAEGGDDGGFEWPSFYVKWN